MLIRAYFPKFITALFGGFFIALGIFSFGNAVIFDRVYIGVLIFTAIICRENINVIAVITILFIQALISEIAWMTLLDGLLIRFVLIIFSLFVCYVCRHDKITRLITPILILVLGAEIYWLYIDYSAPATTWYIWLNLSTLGVRYLLMYRVSFVDQYFSNKGESINLDWVMYKLTAFFILTQILMILEYLIRHIFDVPNMILVYSLYPYLIQGLTTVSIWVVFHESYKLLLPKILKV
ncbi:hypothetical protein [Paraglaciecola sp.]|uniref:hypothetical protein n=1 Tax=Paraglaciecola sp. TaxID=1920173 RepID=UPI003EF73B85